jgi:single-strand DNA-binding protein
MNISIISGNLTRDPEIRYVGSGAAVCKFTIANTEHSKGEEYTNFVDIVSWEKLAENCNTYLKKGMKVHVEGRLSIRSYDDKDGKKRKATEIVARKVDFPTRNGAGAQRAEQRQAAGVGAPAGGGNFGGEESFEDEIPF